jgi:hypothetical protein
MDGGADRTTLRRKRQFYTSMVAHMLSVRHERINISSDRLLRGRKWAAFVPEYGLAPEHPFPAAVDETLASYRGRVENGFAKIALACDLPGAASRLPPRFRRGVDNHKQCIPFR